MQCHEPTTAILERWGTLSKHGCRCSFFGGGTTFAFFFLFFFFSFPSVAAASASASLPPVQARESVEWELPLSAGRIYPAPPIRGPLPGAPMHPLSQHPHLPPLRCCPLVRLPLALAERSKSRWIGWLIVRGNMLCST